MTCYHPLKGFIIGKTDSGKNKIKVCKRNTECVQADDYSLVYNSIPIPCGTCIGCKLDYSRQWAIRCVLESSFYDSNYFITLTYDDENCPKFLVKDDLRRFINSLRKHCERYNLPSPRFFSCGEYGSTSLRPHFHLILFNLYLDDLKVYKRTDDGILYNSETITNLWHKGYAVIGEVNYKTCAYVARYVTKKLDKSILEEYGFPKEFVLMSRRPGIGFGYFDQNHEKIYECDKIYFSMNGVDSFSPPHYFDKLLDKLDPYLLEKVKDKRLLKSGIYNSLKLLETDKDLIGMLQSEEEDKLARIKSLKRSKSC